VVVPFAGHLALISRASDSTGAMQSTRFAAWRRRARTKGLGRKRLVGITSSAASLRRGASRHHKLIRAMPMHNICRRHRHALPNKQQFATDYRHGRCAGGDPVLIARSGVARRRGRLPFNPIYQRGLGVTDRPPGLDEIGSSSFAPPGLQGAGRDRQKLCRLALGQQARRVIGRRFHDVSAPHGSKRAFGVRRAGARVSDFRCDQ